MKLAIPSFFVRTVDAAAEEAPKASSSAGRRDIDADDYEMTKFGRRRRTPLKAKRTKVAAAVAGGVATVACLIWLIL